jgi:hypothetical protein
MWKAYAVLLAGACMGPAIGCVRSGGRLAQLSELETDYQTTPGRPNFSVRGSFRGTARLEGGAVHVVVLPGARIEMSELIVARRFLERGMTLRAGLAAGSRRGAWDLPSMSEPVELMRHARAHADSLGVYAIPDTLRFVLRVPSRARLDRTWLAFEFRWEDDQVPAFPGVRQVTTYSHTDSLIFARAAADRRLAR